MKRTLSKNTRRKRMNNSTFIVAIYPSHTAAEAAVKALPQAGFDRMKLAPSYAALASPRTALTPADRDGAPTPGDESGREVEQKG
jgi:hypothetical protein